SRKRQRSRSQGGAFGTSERHSSPGLAPGLFRSFPRWTFSSVACRSGSSPRKCRTRAIMPGLIHWALRLRSAALPCLVKRSDTSRPSGYHQVDGRTTMRKLKALAVVGILASAPALADDDTLEYQFTCSAPGMGLVVVPFGDRLSPGANWYTDRGRGPYVF